VLFHAAARVKNRELPPNTEIRAHLYESTEDGPEIDYRVWEEVHPPTEPSEETVGSFPPNLGRLNAIGWMHRDQDVRGPTLKLDLASLQVRHISAVTFTTKDYTVHRHRVEKRDWPI
jgi:hypothetical protein